MKKKRSKQIELAEIRTCRMSWRFLIRKPLRFCLSTSAWHRRSCLGRSDWSGRLGRLGSIVRSSFYSIRGLQGARLGLDAWWIRRGVPIFNRGLVNCGVWQWLVDESGRESSSTFSVTKWCDRARLLSFRLNSGSTSGGSLFDRVVSGASVATTRFRSGRWFRRLIGTKFRCVL